MWIVLPPFEEGMQEPWFPDINLSENIMITSSGSLHPRPLTKGLFSHFIDLLYFAMNNSQR